MTLANFSPCRAVLVDDTLRFDKGDLHQALQDGCFALRIPDDFSLSPGTRLAREFYLPAASAEEAASTVVRGYRGFRAKPDIYFDRDHFQTEHILIDGPGRRREFPEAVNVMCEQMYAIARLVLAGILSTAGVERSLWGRITDYSIEGRGVQWFAVSHYRPERQQLGAPAHKDTGFVTVLFCDQPGLEARINGEWQDVEPVAGHFLVNFGGALEVLLARMPVRTSAVLHRVRQSGSDPVYGDRFSFAAFLNPAAEGELYQVVPCGVSAYPVGSVEAFLRKFNEETWKDDYGNFGILKGESESSATGEDRR